MISADVKAYKNNSKRSSDCILQIYKYLTSTLQVPSKLET